MSCAVGTSGHKKEDEYRIWAHVSTLRAAGARESKNSRKVTPTETNKSGKVGKNFKKSSERKKERQS